MIWYELHLLNKLDKDAVAINRLNKKTIERYKRDGYVSSLGVAPKGPKKGVECVIINPSSYRYQDQLKRERKETFRFWIALWMNPLSAILGAVIGYLLGKNSF